MAGNKKLMTYNSSGEMPSGGQFGLDKTSATEVHATGTNERKRSSHSHKPFGKLGAKGHPD